MTELEIYYLLYSNSWKSDIFEEIVRFISTGNDSFEIQKIMYGNIVECHTFERIKYDMTNEDFNDPNNKILKFTYLGFYIYVVNENKIKINLPGLGECYLNRINTEYLS